MERPNKNFSAAMFKPVPGGWVYRLPNPWVFGDSPHYLVNDELKSQIEATVPRRRPAVVGAIAITTTFAWVLIVTTIVSIFGSGADHPTSKDLVAIVTLILVPIFGALPLLAWIQKRRVQPLLEGVRLSDERITSEDMRQSLLSEMSMKQLLFVFMSGVFASTTMAYSAILHLVSKHYPQAAFWSLIAIVIGLSTISRYRQILEKANQSARKGDQ
jgi:hypothetical protein